MSPRNHFHLLLLLHLCLIWWSEGRVGKSETECRRESKREKMGLHLDPRAKMRIGGIKLERKETERINIRRRTSQKKKQKWWTNWGEKKSGGEQSSKSHHSCPTISPPTLWLCNAVTVWQQRFRLQRRRDLPPASGIVALAMLQYQRSASKTFCLVFMSF